MTSILKVDTIQDADGNNIINERGNTIAIGASGDTINVPSGATFNINGTAGTGVGISGWSSSSGSLLPASASAGIYLGVNSATAANLLDDYEEGTWTPAATGASTAGTGVTGAGRYTKFGNLVHIDFSFVSKTISGASGDLRITGLPFTVSGADSVRGAFGGNVRFYNYNLDGNTYYQITLVADENTSYLVVTQTRDHGTWSTLAVDNDSGLYIEGGITYTTTA